MSLRHSESEVKRLSQRLHDATQAQQIAANTIADLENQLADLAQAQAAARQSDATGTAAARRLEQELRVSKRQLVAAGEARDEADSEATQLRVRCAELQEQQRTTAGELTHAAAVLTTAKVCACPSWYTCLARPGAAAHDGGGAVACCSCSYHCQGVTIVCDIDERVLTLTARCLVGETCVLVLVLSLPPVCSVAHGIAAVTQPVIQPTIVYARITRSATLT